METMKTFEMLTAIVVIFSTLIIAFWSVKSAGVMNEDLGDGLKVISIGII